MKFVKCIFSIFLVVFIACGQNNKNKTGKNNLLLRKFDSTGRTVSEESLDPNKPLPDNLVAVEAAPSPIKKASPVYPERALKEHIEGIVELRALIGIDGKIKRVIVVSSSNSIFNNAAIKAMKQWIFIPAKAKGKSIESWVEVPFNFNLKK